MHWKNEETFYGQTNTSHKGYKENKPKKKKPNKVEVLTEQIDG